jgi:hypothetical protein
MVSYNIQTIEVEFVKDYKKECNQFFLNQVYNFYPLYADTNIYLPNQFDKNETVGYMKLKNKDLFLYENPKTKQLYFDKIRMGDYTYQQPLVLWFGYINENTFVIYKHLGYSLDSVAIHIYNHVSNAVYLNYVEDNGTIRLKWVPNTKLATKFTFSVPIWSEFSWIKLTPKNI